VGFLDEAVAAAEEAGAVLQEVRQRGFTVGSKAGMEYVTEADILAEDLLRNRLTQLFPGSSFLGEETWNGSFPNPPFWVVDPLDGTNNYAVGIPFYCVSVALVDERGLSLGIIHDPVHRETFLGMRGQGAFLNGEPISVSDAKSLSDAVLATGFPYTRTENDLTFDLNVLKGFLGRARGIRRCGSAALDLAYTAAGRLGGFWEEKLNPWDMAAGVLLVREAGGIVTGFRESSWEIASKGVQCSAPGIWDEFRHIIEKGAPKQRAPEDSNS